MNPTDYHVPTATVLGKGKKKDSPLLTRDYGDNYGYRTYVNLARLVMFRTSPFLALHVPGYGARAMIHQGKSAENGARKI